MHEMDTERFIEAVRARRFLYDPSHALNRNRIVTDRAWREIAKEFNTENMTLAKARWKNLKDSYMKFLRSGNASGKVLANYRQWRWAENMSFVKAFAKPRAKLAARVRRRDSTDEEDEGGGGTASKRWGGGGIRAADNPPDSDDDGRDDDHSRDDDNDDEDRPLKTNIKIEAVSVPQHDALADVPEPPRDEISYLFLSYAETFRRLERRRQVMLRAQLAQLFVRAELEELAETSGIEPDVSSQLRVAFSLDGP